MYSVWISGLAGFDVSAGTGRFSIAPLRMRGALQLDIGTAPYHCNLTCSPDNLQHRLFEAADCRAPYYGTHGRLFFSLLDRSRTPGRASIFP